MITDHHLIAVYSSLGETADRIVCFSDLRQRFLTELQLTNGTNEGDDALWRLLMLRKQGRLPIHS